MNDYSLLLGGGLAVLTGGALCLLATLPSMWDPLLRARARRTAAWGATAFALMIATAASLILLKPEQLAARILVNDVSLDDHPVERTRIPIVGLSIVAYRRANGETAMHAIRTAEIDAFRNSHGKAQLVAAGL